MGIYFHKYETAAKAAKEVMDLGVTDYSRITRTCSYRVENNKEVIFDRQNAYKARSTIRPDH